MLVGDRLDRRDGSTVFGDHRRVFRWKQRYITNAAGRSGGERAGVISLYESREARLLLTQRAAYRTRARVLGTRSPYFFCPVRWQS